MSDYELTHAEGWKTGRGSGRESTPQIFSIAEKPAPKKSTSAVKGPNTAVVIEGPLIDVGISPEKFLYPKENPAGELKMADAPLDDDHGPTLKQIENTTEIDKGHNNHMVILEDGSLIGVDTNPEKFLYRKENPALDPKMTNEILDDEPGPTLQQNGNSMKFGKGQHTVVVSLEDALLINVGISPEKSLYPKEITTVEPKMANENVDEHAVPTLKYNGNSMKIDKDQDTDRLILEAGPLIDVGICPENSLYRKENPALEPKMAIATLEDHPVLTLQQNGNSIDISAVKSKAANETRVHDSFPTSEYSKTGTATNTAPMDYAQKSSRSETPVKNQKAQWKAPVREKTTLIQTVQTLPSIQKTKMNGLGPSATPSAAASSSRRVSTSADAHLAAPTPRAISASVPPHLVGISKVSPAKYISEVTTQLPSLVPTTNATNISTNTKRGPTSTWPPPKRRHVVTLARKKDNPARADFRAGRRYNATFMLTKACIDIEPDVKKMEKVLEEIGVRFGSFIRPPQSSTDRTLLIWGKPPQIAHTLRELNQWVAASAAPSQSSILARMSHVTKGGNEFAKVSLSIEEAAKVLDRQLQEQAMKHKYQKIPDKSLSFKFIGYFLWPVEEVRPEDLLGPSFEAFDPLRMSFNTYILFDAKLEAFKVMADQAEMVVNAMLRIEGTFKEFVARCNATTTVYMVERPDEMSLRKDVQMVKRSLSPSEHALVPSLAGDRLEPSELVKWSGDTKSVEEEQLFSFHENIEAALSRLRFFRGRVHMRVLLGTFALTTYRRGPESVTSIPLERFIQDIKLSATKGRMLQDLQFHNTEDALKLISGAQEVFQPIDCTSLLLDTMFPVFVGRFQLDIPGTGLVRLEVEVGSSHSTASAAGEHYDCLRAEWFRATDENVKPLEIFNIRLQSNISWQFQTTSCNTLDDSRITPAMCAFAGSVRWKGLSAELHKADFTGRRVFTWNYGVKIISFEQKTALRYRLASNRNWIFELARYDSYISLKSSTNPTATRYRASVWSKDWDRLMCSNQSLEIGQQASWEPTIEKFFGANEPGTTEETSGLKVFLGDMKRISKLLEDTQQPSAQENEILLEKRLVSQPRSKMIRVNESSCKNQDRSACATTETRTMVEEAT